MDMNLKWYIPDLLLINDYTQLTFNAYSIVVSIVNTTVGQKHYMISQC